MSQMSQKQYQMSQKQYPCPLCSHIYFKYLKTATYAVKTVSLTALVLSGLRVTEYVRKDRLARGNKELFYSILLLQLKYSILL